MTGSQPALAATVVFGGISLAYGRWIGTLAVLAADGDSLEPPG